MVGNDSFRLFKSQNIVEEEAGLNVLFRTKCKCTLPCEVFPMPYLYSFYAKGFTIYLSICR
jgi:hypothetical protein